MVHLIPYQLPYQLPITSKMFEKYLWKSDILSKDASRWPESSLKMSLFRRCFSNSLLVKINYLVYPKVEHCSEMGSVEAPKTLWLQNNLQQFTWTVQYKEH